MKAIIQWTTLKSLIKKTQMESIKNENIELENKNKVLFTDLHKQKKECFEKDKEIKAKKDIVLKINDELVTIKSANTNLRTSQDLFKKTIKSKDKELHDLSKKN